MRTSSAAGSPTKRSEAIANQRIDDATAVGTVQLDGGRRSRSRGDRAPSSVAVVGAAATPGNVGRAVLASIIGGGFQGVVTLVNREGGVVCSLRAARSFGELEVAAELVIIAAVGDDVLEFAADAAANARRGIPGNRPRRSGTEVPGDRSAVRELWGPAVTSMSTRSKGRRAPCSCCGAAISRSSKKAQAFDSSSRGD